jgi:N-sulfoglucosamine sulfohydrolase
VLLKRLEESGEADHTLVVISGDHGMPGVPSGKCNLYDHGVSVALIIRLPGGKAGRIVEDYTCLPDLAPTFMEIGGLQPPKGLYGRSLLPILKSEKSGQIDPTRTTVITGRERHVAAAREGLLPYPMRALRTPEFVYIRNFAPDRWPLGAPGHITENETPSQQALEHNTFIGFADMDASPTKAWLVQHRTASEGKWFYNVAFGKRPAEELYDVRRDPDEVMNLADQPAYAEIKAQLSAQLLKTLTDAGDPRVVGDGKKFDRPPFTGDDDPKPNRKPGKNLE